jgi:hypothetical protein
LTGAAPETATGWLAYSATMTAVPQCLLDNPG